MSRTLKKYVRRIRDRDGDDCWICDKPIRFDLVGNHGNGCSVDHVQPRSLGGATSVSNLKLAHQACNVGRERGQFSKVLGRKLGRYVFPHKGYVHGDGI